MGNRRNAWRKKAAAAAQAPTKKKGKHKNKRADNPDPENPKGDGPDISAIPKVGSLRQWDKNMKTEARVRRRPNGVSIRTNPDPPQPKPKKPDKLPETRQSNKKNMA